MRYGWLTVSGQCWVAGTRPDSASTWDAGEAEVERWFVAAALFGAPISARVAERAFGVLAAAGLARIGQLRHVPAADLIGMLDTGGYARYDIRTATRLLQLYEVIRDRYDGQVALIGRGSRPTRSCAPPWTRCPGGAR